MARDLTLVPLIEEYCAKFSPAEQQRMRPILGAWVDWLRAGEALAASRETIRGFLRETLALLEDAR